jgi:hypothetical protein
MLNGLSKISETDFTSLYLAADDASKTTQKSYIIIIAFDLSLMVIASALAIYNYESTDLKLTLYILSGLFLLISTFLTVVLLTRKFEDFWYQGRALAESCKTLTWRFMTRSELFEDGVPLQQAKTKFVQRVEELTREFPDLNKVIKADLLNKPVITQKMLDVRNLSLADRKRYYIEERIEEQKIWYAKKASYNNKKYILWFSIIIACQALSLISMVFLISNPKLNWNLVGFFTTVSAASLSWLQLKRHQELKQAYTTTSKELNMILALADNINNENEFSKFVLDSENAVSREHTLWLAQRRK